MKKNISLSVLFLILTLSTVLAQSKYRDGFIITLQNDTIYGLIEYKEGSGQHKICKFKKTAEMEVENYKPNDILGYRYADDKFFSVKEITKWDKSVEKLFLEVLVKGEASLYKYGSYFFIEKADTAFNELTNEEVKAELRKRGNRAVRNTNYHIGVLTYLFSDCGQLKGAIEGVNLNEKELTKLVEQYNECVGVPSVSYKGLKPWTKLDLGVLVGMASSSLKIEKLSSQFSYLEDNYSSIDPLFGIILGISFPRIVEKISLQTELHFVKTSYSSLIETSYLSNPVYYDTYIDISTISVPLSLKYTFPGRKYSFYFQVGLNYDFNISSETLVIEEVVRTSPDGFVVNTNKAEAFEINQSQLGYWGGIGVVRRLKHFNLGATVRYTKLTELSKTEDLNVNNDRLTLSIILSKK